MTMPQTSLAVQERHQTVAALYLQRKMQSEIARIVGVSQQQVSFDLKAIRLVWQASTLRDFDAARSEELARVDVAEAAYWDGWQRSQQVHEVTTTEAHDDGAIARRKATLRKEAQSGDPRFLDGVLRCIERRCALLGLDAPKRVSVDWNQLTNPQLERLAAGEPLEKVMAEA
jgi:hypothetical protein